MNKTIKRIVESAVRSVLNESALQPGAQLTTQWVGEQGKYKLAKMYHVSPDDFDYVANGKYVYKSSAKTRAAYKKAKKMEYKGIKEGQTIEDYLEDVRRHNKKFAEAEKLIEGEEWRPIVNKGRFFSGEADFSKDFEVSNMGRIRIIDLEDPMRSIITTGYDASKKGARQLTLKIPGMRTTPPIHTLVADAWLPEPEGGIENYYVEHIDGNYHNNRADNLRYVPKKGRAERKAAEAAQAPVNGEVIDKVVAESIRRVLNEGTTSNLAYERWEQLKEYPGCEQMVDDIFNYLSSDQIDKLIEWFNEDYELWDDDAEDEEW